MFRGAIIIALFVSLSGCSDIFFRDGGPNRAFDPDSVAEIEPRFEPLSLGGNPASYSVFGKQYHVMGSSAGFVQRGNASWYGTKFHGNNTSNGERYDMYAISAAHKRLPIPTYLEVTNLENGRRLIVRVNDRGPFHSDRIIDLSYAAAAKLGYADKGTAPVEIRAIDVAHYQREKLRTTPSRASSQVTTTPLQTTMVPVALKATSLPPEEYAAAAEPISPTAPSSAMQRTAIAKSPMEKPAAGSADQQIEKNPLTNAAKKRLYIQLGAFSSRANAEQMVIQTRQAQITTAGRATIQSITSNSKVIYRVRLGPFSSETSASQILQHLIQQNIGEPRIFHDS